MPESGKKIVKRRSKLYALRLWQSDDPNDPSDQTPYVEILERWLNQRPSHVSVGAEINRIFIEFMKRYMDEMGEEVKNPVLQRLDDIEDLIRQLLRNPGSVQRLVEAQQHFDESDGELPDDILQNILEG